MKLSPLPDLGSNRRLALTALVVTLAVAAAQLWFNNDAVKALGDTDDAMRLVLVRDLLHGRGWYDQWVGRLQPPLGTYMHWSRLLDGALAAAIWLFERVLPPADAELMVRIVWPLAWTFPAVCCGLAIARTLGGRPAVVVCAILLASNIQLYVQFRPGRVDHHDIQITMALIAAVGALAETRRERWAAAAGLAAALGLAIGIEALAFQALVGAAYGYRLAREPQEAAGSARAYGLALALGTLVLFCIQTPPWRWSLSFCDAMGCNLAAGLIVAGLGIAAVATWGARLGGPARLGLLALVAAASAGVFLGLDPQCLHGPFGAVDPRLRGFWFDNIQELQDWPRLLRHDRIDAVRVITMTAMAVAAALYLLARERLKARPCVLLFAALVLTAAVAASHAYRMQDYIYWFGMPTLAAAFSLTAARRLHGRMLPTLLASLVLSPACVALAVLGVMQLGPKTPAQPLTYGACFDRAPYAPLAALPPGLVLAEINLGPFILAETHDSVLAAPYHRMSWGILAAHQALGAAPTDAEAQVRALRVDYVVDCPAHPLRVGPRSFQARLRAGWTPAWLHKLSSPREPIQIYRVAPPSGG